jgi:hypothetical protein
MAEPVEPLSVADELVLLTLDCPRGRVRRALKVAGLPPLRQVTRELERRQLVNARRLRRPEPDPSAPMRPLRGRLGSIVWSVDRPSNADGELLMLVAFAGGLDGVSAAAHLRARHQIAALGDRRHAPPALLATLCDEAGVKSARELAAKLLPGRVRVGPGDLDPGVNEAIWGGGHGGGTLG